MEGSVTREAVPKAPRILPRGADQADERVTVCDVHAEPGPIPTQSSVIALARGP
jgi:hypothetical protein